MPYISAPQVTFAHPVY